jgi:hypothetical protein
MFSGQSVYILGPLHLADQIAIFEERKNPPPLPRSEKTKNVIDECFVKLWTEGDNWLTRKDFFNMCRAEFKVQSCVPITYRHLLRILEAVGLAKYFPPMRQRRKVPQKSRFAKNPPQRNVAETLLAPVRGTTTRGDALNFRNRGACGSPADDVRRRILPDNAPYQKRNQPIQVV